MRVAIASLSLLFVTTTASAQPTPCSSQALGYDPYKPSDLAIMREYGGTLLAQAPLSTLLRLDPYVPSQGELLRQLGNGIPLWPAYPWPIYAGVAAPDCDPEVRSSVETPPPTPRELPLTTFADVMNTLEQAPASARSSTTTRMPVGPRGERRSGVWVQYAGRTWISAGPAVPFRDSDFTRVGESAGFPVFQRGDKKENLIYLPTTRGMVAPFRVSS